MKIICSSDKMNLIFFSKKLSRSQYQMGIKITISKGINGLVQDCSISSAISNGDIAVMHQAIDL